MFVPCLQWVMDQLTAIIASKFTTSPYVRCHLAQPPFTPTPFSVPGDFTEATFTGYSAQVLQTFGTVHLDAKNQPTTESGAVASFAPSGVLSTPQEIAGYWLIDQAGEMIGAEPFPAIITVSNPATPINFTVSQSINGGAQQVVILP